MLSASGCQRGGNDLIIGAGVGWDCHGRERAVNYMSRDFGTLTMESEGFSSCGQTVVEFRLVQAAGWLNQDGTFHSSTDGAWSEDM